MNAKVSFGSLGQNRGNGNGKQQKKDLPVNLAMRLDKIEIGGKDGKPSYFIGFDATTGEPLRVRMATVDEGVALNLRAGDDADKVRDRIHKQYVGVDAAHRPRPGEINDPNNKVHCASGGLLMFSRAMKNEDGSHRAHWVETLERGPGGNCEKAMVHVAVDPIIDKKDKKTVKGKNVIADVIYTDKAIMLNKDNVRSTLLPAFSPTDGEIKRRPFVALRLIEKATGDVKLKARASAQYVETERIDGDTGEVFTNYDADTAENSVARLLTKEVGKGDDALVVRGAMWGLSNAEGYPDLSDVEDQNKVADVKGIIDYIRSGALLVEAIPGERISAGPATRASIIKATELNDKNPINWYTQRKPNGFVQERRFAPTFLATMVGKDGYRFFNKAVFVDAQPKPVGLVKVVTVNDHASGAEAAKTRVEDDQSLEGAAPFNPGALDNVPEESLDAGLAASAAALDHGHGRPDFSDMDDSIPF